MIRRGVELGLRSFLSRINDDSQAEELFSGSEFKIKTKNKKQGLLDSPIYIRDKQPCFRVLSWKSSCIEQEFNSPVQSPQKTLAGLML